METLYFEKTSELKRSLAMLKKKLPVKLSLVGRRLTISGSSIQEYEALMILKAMQFGFSSDKALQLLDEEFELKIIHIRDYTRRKNLKDVKSRIIGRKGQTRRVLEEISACSIIIKEDSNEVGIIGSVENIESALVAITNIIKGSKQTNAYKYLEKQNKNKKINKSGLGIKK